MAKTALPNNQIKAIVDRVERLEEEKKALVSDIGEVYAEARGTGFDVKTLRQVVRLRRLDKAAFQEKQAMLAPCLDAVGLGGTPLGEYAVKTATAKE